MSDSIVITAARRTAIGAFQGQFAPVSSPELGAAAIRAARGDSGIEGDDVSEVLMGCVLPAGTGQAPARQASIGAGLPLSAGCTTLNKVCGSGMKAVMLGRDAILAGSANVVVAGGMESMTNAPYLVKRGLRMGHDKLIDHMFFDGLQNPYDGQMMGGFGEMCADKYAFSREQQDSFSRTSVERANRAIADGLFANEIAPVTVTSRKGDVEIATDEEPGRVNVDKIPNLRPAFAKDGTITAASSSKISDGAAALVLMSADNASQRGIQPLARIVAHATHSQEPEWFTTA
ncbi:MAG: acetyl-CoA C-acyltransferase, partial [Wenzhouxiangellaceae bacterium]